MATMHSDIVWSRDTNPGSVKFIKFTDMEVIRADMCYDRYTGMMDIGIVLEIDGYQDAYCKVFHKLTDTFITDVILDGRELLGFIFDERLLAHIIKGMYDNGLIQTQVEKLKEQTKKKLVNNYGTHKTYINKKLMTTDELIHNFQNNNLEKMCKDLKAELDKKNERIKDLEQELQDMKEEIEMLKAINQEC
jgi:hypothetical protein